MRAFSFHKSRKLFLSALLAVVVVFVQPAFATTPLDDYVAAADGSYGWALNTTISETDYTAYILDLTSQNWRSSSEVSPTQWEHTLVIVKPNTVRYDEAMLLIGGGDNGDPIPGAGSLEMLTAASTAIATNSVIAYLGMIPNQPLAFVGDTETDRREDSLIAYSWDKYIQSYLGDTPDNYWPAQLPMTKSAIRAMDAVQEFCASPGGGELTINDFVVAGGSKRGWTTWLAAAVDATAADPRVSAVVPMVIDVLNIKASMNHHHDTYGFWAPAMSDYVDMGIMDHINNPEFQALMDIVDPYVYRDRLTMPKYIVNSTGDQFFLPDSSQFYYDDLPGEKYLRYVPNTDHTLVQEALDVLASLTVYYLAHLQGLDLPDFSWTLQEDGSITIETTTDTLLEVKLWQATNSSARDFRYDTIGAAWSDSILTDLGGGTYLADVSSPTAGWTAFFAELTFDSGLGTPYKFTTEVVVVPEPASIMLLAFGALAVVAQRRRS